MLRGVVPIAATAALLALAMPAAPALASVASASGSVLRFEAGAGEPNAGVVRIVGSDFVVEENAPGTPFGAGAGCSMQDGAAVCPAAGITRVEVVLGDGDDSVVLETALASDIDAGEGADQVTGGPGADAIRGGDGPDVLDGGRGADVLAGGPGRDAVSYAARTAAVAVTLDGVADDGEAGEGDSAGADIEDVVGSAGNDRLVGNGAANTLTGGPGADALAGGDGPDVLDGGAADASADALAGGAGADTLSGAAGDDALDGGPDGDAVDGGAGADALAGGDGADSLAGGDGDDLLDGGEAADTIGGGAGSDTVSYAGVAGVPVGVALDGVANDGPLGAAPDAILGDVENAVGGAQDDDLAGSDGANALTGGGGEDLVVGAGGADVLAGGDAPDVVRARDNGPDTVDCGPGRDLAITDRDDRPAGCEHVAFAGRAPRAGANVVVAPVRVRGAQLASLPQMAPRGMGRLVPLQERLSLPVRSRIDVARGVVSLTAAPASGKRFRRGRFGPTLKGTPARNGVGGELVIAQSRRRGAVVDLRLRGGSFRGCLVRSSADSSRRRRRSRRVVRRVWGNARGRFRTRGRYSAATVRGTVWLVEDRCDGTLTRVRRGRVVVTDVVRGRVVTLRRGDSYLATPRGTRPRLERARPQARARG